MMKKSYITIYSMVILAVILLSVGCIKLDYNNPGQDVLDPDRETNEITEVDVFSIPNITSLQISVFGLKLGDSEELLIDVIGQPDLKTQVGPNDYNYEYRERFMEEYVGLLVHTTNGTITTFTFRPPFNKFMKGETKIEHTKEDVYRMFGKADRLELASYFTIYHFNEKGIDVVVRGKEMRGFSLTLPKPSERDQPLVVNTTTTEMTY